MAGFRDEHRGFLLTINETRDGFEGEVRPTTPEAERAIHGFRMTRGNVLGRNLDDAAKAFFADTRAMIDKLFPA